MLKEDLDSINSAVEQAPSPDTLFRIGRIDQNSDDFIRTRRIHSTPRNGVPLFRKASGGASDPQSLCTKIET